MTFYYISIFKVILLYLSTSILSILFISYRNERVDRCPFSSRHVEESRGCAHPSVASFQQPKDNTSAASARRRVLYIIHRESKRISLRSRPRLFRGFRTRRDGSSPHALPPPRSYLSDFFLLFPSGFFERRDPPTEHLCIYSRTNGEPSQRPSARSKRVLGHYGARGPRVGAARRPLRGFRARAFAGSSR